MIAPLYVAGKKTLGTIPRTRFAFRYNPDTKRLTIYRPHGLEVEVVNAPRCCECNYELDDEEVLAVLKNRTYTEKPIAHARCADCLDREP